MNTRTQNYLPSTNCNCLPEARHWLILLLVFLISCEKPTANKPVKQPLVDQGNANTTAAPTEHSVNAATVPMEKSELTGKNNLVIVTTEPSSVADFRVRVEAVKQLGEERSIEAIPLLIYGLMKIKPFVLNNALDLQESYPCMVALAQIGEPAVAPITKRFEATPSEQERQILLLTLVRIKGKEWVVSYLTQVDKSNRSSASKTEIGELQAWVTSLQPN